MLGETDSIADTRREGIAIEDPTPMIVQATPKRHGPTLIDGSRRQRSHSLGGGANSPMKRRTGSRHHGFRPKSMAEWELDQWKLEKSDTERSRDENLLAGDEEGRERGRGNDERGRSEEKVGRGGDGQGGTRGERRTREEGREGGGKVGGSEGRGREGGGGGSGGGEGRGREGGIEGRGKERGEGGSGGGREDGGRVLENKARGSDGKAEGRKGHRSVRHWYSTGSVGMSGPATWNGPQVLAPIYDLGLQSSRNESVAYV